MADFYFPPPAFYFNVEVKNKDTPFQEVSGLDVELETTDITEGGLNEFKHRVPVRTKYNNLVLKRGLAEKGAPIIEWATKTILTPGNLNEAIELNDIKVTLNNEKGDPLMTWNFVNAYPVKWSVANLNAQENAIAIETIEFSYQRYSIE